MDFWFVAVSALLLFSLDLAKAIEHNSTSPNFTTAAQTIQPSALRLGLVTVVWGPGCEGSVVLTHLDGNSRQNVCFSSTGIKTLLRGVCVGRKGCRGEETLWKSGGIQQGVQNSERDLEKTLCFNLTVECEVEEQRPLEEPQEPVGFRVATAVLCVALILLLLLCFSKPTVRALQKRLSNKRKNRWIGPTQSHSVSYHRGQTVNKDIDGQKQSSYPALDRLVLGNREPSSNRNSYNL